MSFMPGGVTFSNFCDVLKFLFAMLVVKKFSPQLFVQDFIYSKKAWRKNALKKNTRSILPHGQETTS
jgi:hypothetical protein